MKLAKGVKTSSRKKTIAKSLEDLPETVTQTALAESKPTETTTGSARSSAGPVTIQAKIDVGFGNSLFLRGEGVGLSWTKGVPLTCVDGGTWQWTGDASEQLKFKLLLNDQVWSQGEDLIATPGQKWKSRRRFKPAIFQQNQRFRSCDKDTRKRFVAYRLMVGPSCRSAPYSVTLVQRGTKDGFVCQQFLKTS